MAEDSKDAEIKILRTKISKIQFPEFCPVCMDLAEDLIFVSITERKGPESYELNSWMKEKEKTSAALESAKGITTFAVPTCMLHGSKSVRTIRTKMVAVLGFFVLFYPILFFLLQINLALRYSRPLMEPLAAAIVLISGMLLLILYGLYPRAIERYLKFENLRRAGDIVDVKLKNREYRKRFLEMNELYTDIISESDEL